MVNKSQLKIIYHWVKLAIKECKPWSVDIPRRVNESDLDETILKHW